MKLTDLLENEKCIGITGHIRPDGDCIGSVLGLYNYLTENMPSADIYLFLEEAGEEFHFLHNIDKIHQKPLDLDFDVFFVLDCSSVDRIEPFLQCFDKAKRTICIDHHISNLNYADVNIVEAASSSTSEVLYKLLDENKISKHVAECIYTGIIHDTGVFKYSCTSSTTMEIAGKLMDKGIDYTEIIDKSFYKKTYIQNQILGRALLESVMFYNGKCIFSAISQDVLDFYGVTGRELEGIVEQLRLTDGVDVAIFMYQTGENEYKVSLRSKKDIDVAQIATYFGGGGHVRAAGFTGVGKVHHIINAIGELIEKQNKWG